MAKRIDGKPAGEVKYDAKAKDPETGKSELDRAVERAQPIQLTKFKAAFAAAAPNLKSYTSGSNAVVGNRISASLREDGTWLCVLAFDDTATFKRMVAFGSGETFEGAIVNLSKSIAGGKFKENVPFSARGER